MKKRLTKFISCLILALLLMSLVEVPGINQITQVEAAAITGKVTSSKLKIYSAQSKTSTKLKTLKKGKKVTVLETGTTWVKISVGGVTGYVKGKNVATAYGTASNPYANTISGKVSANVVLRAGNSKASAALSSLTKNSSIQILKTGKKWTKVKVGNTIGYIKTKYVGTSSGGSANGLALVAIAKKYLGNPYKYGGTSLTNGADCSGFVMALYKLFGYNLPHSSSALRKVGRAVKGGIKNAQPGDIICYDGHVAIYIGNNSVIHASNPKNGIKITNNASYRKIVAIRRIFK